jgi:micrococcal nuclease
MSVSRSPRRNGFAGWVVAAFAGFAGWVVAAFAGLAGCGERPDCGPRQAVVERVIDGDTIVVTGGVRVRYLLVNAPETSGDGECFGANAAQFNADLVLGKTVELSYDVACADMFGRTLAYVTVDGQDVNQLLVERGYACVLHIPPDGDARADELEALESAARTAKRGLWGACDPIPCN